jgi:hypothetical protein
MNGNINFIIVVVVVVVDLITLLSIYMVGNHGLCQNVSGIRLSQGKEIHPIP